MGKQKMVLLPFQQYESLRDGGKPAVNVASKKRRSPYTRPVQSSVRQVNRRLYNPEQPYQSLASVIRRDERLRPGFNERLDALLDHLERNPSRFQVTGDGKEMVLDGNRVPLTDSKQIVNRFIYNTPSSVTPRGWYQCLDALETTGAPPLLIEGSDDDDEGEEFEDAVDELPDRKVIKREDDDDYEERRAIAAAEAAAAAAAANAAAANAAAAADKLRVATPAPTARRRATKRRRVEERAMGTRRIGTREMTSLFSPPGRRRGMRGAKREAMLAVSRNLASKRVRNVRKEYGTNRDK